MQSRTVTERFKTAPWAVEAVFSEERGLFQFHGKCERPHEIYVRGLPDKLLVSLGREAQTPVVGSMLVRCRKCAPCLEHRSTLWAARACTEVSLAPGRTWFGTLTLRPEAQFQATVRARVACRQRQVDWDALDEGERFSEIHGHIVRDLQMWLKRVRSRSEARIRYLLVVEAHKSGLPHYHCLIHEHVGTVTNRVLTASWPLGFTKFKLVPRDDPAQAFYVCKYLSKSALGRVLASARYGTADLQPLTRAVEAPPATERRNESDEREGAEPRATHPTRASEASASEE